MIKTSWCKKIWSGRSKGVSSVIGTVFLMLIIFMVSTNVLLWTFSQNAQYNEAVKASNQEEADRRNENVVATEGNYSVFPGGKVKVEAELTNAGSMAAQIINLWVFDASRQRYNSTSLDLNLNPGDVTYLVDEKAITVTIPEAGSMDTFNSWFVTARGNTVPLEAEQAVIVAHIAGGIGSLALDFNEFRYFFYNDSIPQKLEDYPTGVASFSVPRTPEIAFGISLTNLDPLKRTMVLNQYSQAWLYFPKSPGQSLVWHIMNVAPNGTILTPYSEISLGFGDSEMLVLASENPGVFSKVSIPAAVKNLPCALNLLLLGTIGPQDYGQNIPFVSLFVYEP